MKFKSELAQEAISIILKDAKDRCHLFNPKEWVKFHNAALARAIEVAAKIELEERRREQEEMKGWAPQDVGPPECEHKNRNPHLLVYKTGGDYTRGPYWLCEKCKNSWDPGFKPKGECPVIK